MAQQTPPQKSTTTRVMDIVQPFLIGGLSGMTATSVIQPIDTVKVRIQLLNKQKAAGKADIKTGPFDVAKVISSKEGVRGFYKGLDSALLRQATYATARLGVYKSLTDHIKESQKKKELSGFEKIYCSITAGFIGAYVGNPMDLILVRFQADGMLPVEKRRNYKHAGDAFMRIIREEGVLSLWRGSTPTVARAIAMNLGMLAPYDEVKDRLNRARGTKDTTSTRLIASCVAGAVAAFVSLPFDNVKTKLQEMHKGPDGKYPYKNIFDCFGKSMKSEGVAGLWVGLPTFYFRVAPHAMITLLTQDFLTDTFNTMRKGKKH